MVVPAWEWLTKQKLFAKREFYTPWGICDLVGVSLYKRRVQQRLRLGQLHPIGCARRIALLNQIPDLESERFITTSQLFADFDFGFSEREIMRQVDGLIDKRFVVRYESGRLQKVNGWAPLHKRIVAFELKLQRVQEALFQAISHLNFATESYVGLPEKKAESASGSVLETFKKAGVGLVAVGPIRCQVLLRSKPRVESDPVLQMHCVERFWRTHVRGNSP
jgi:hypothetical protein